MSKRRKLFLFTGIPGTGKTTTAEYLVKEHAFVHFDRETFDQWPWYLRTLWIRNLPLFIAWTTFWHKKVVVSWGFLPSMDNHEIRQLIEQGFLMIWFDGEREVARREFLKRNTASEETFDAQVLRIEGLHLESFPHMKLNPFGLNRQFLRLADIARKIFDNDVL
jgi:adenylate kinase family enzyme